MKSPGSWLARIAARLYPRAWRDRYGEEFEALLEDAGAGWRDVFNVISEALRMQLTSKKALVLGLIAGLAVGLIWWSLLPKICEARVIVAAPGDAATVNGRAQKVLSYRALGELVNRRNLYAGLRLQDPLEDVLERMRHDIVMRRGPGGVSLAFSYEDPAQARDVAEELAASLDLGTVTNRPDASHRQSPFVPLSLGLLAGGLVGLLFLAAGRRFLGGGIAGGAAFLLVACWMPSTYRSHAVIQGGPPNRESLVKAIGDRLRLDPVAIRDHIGIEIGIEAHRPSTGPVLLAYSDTDRWRAQRAVVAMVDVLRPPDVIDEPTLPQLPISPNHSVISGAGFAAGGLLALFRRRPGRKPRTDPISVS